MFAGRVRRAIIEVVVDDGLEAVMRGELDLLRPEVRASRSRLEALLDDEFIEIGASGRRWERSEIIGNLIKSPALDVTVADMNARRVSGRIALVTYVTLSVDRRVLRSSWWRETDAGWRCLFHQGTVSPKADSAD